MRIAPEGWPVIAVVAAVTILPVAGAALVWWPAAAVLALPALAVLGWAVWFFRDPERTTPAGDDLVISPADGVVIRVDEAELPPELRGLGAPEGRLARITVFLNIFNVHVNRVPVTGRIVKVAYTPGKFLTASLDKAGEENERSAVLMRDARGRWLAFAQIAGMIAKRIVNHLREGQEVRAGERFGLIRFGSRAELWLPPGSVVRVAKGQKIVAGETVLAEMGRAAPVVEAKQPAAAGAAR